MDQNIGWFYETRAQAVIKTLGRNRIQASFAKDAAEAAAKTLAMIPQGASVALGGSMTLLETGIVDGLRQAPISLIDRFAKDLSQEESLSRLRQGLQADFFLAGVNAVTEQGELVFVDASCTRVGPILFGPKKVILVAGCNKIVPNLAYAQERIRHFVAPTNAKRLGRKTPCAQTGQCADCDSPDRICNVTAVIHKQADAQRLHVVLVGQELGL